jgi:hypothetical protein
VQNPSGKISVDPSILRVHTQRASGGDYECNHDWVEMTKDQLTEFPDKPDAGWKCSKCNRRITYLKW